MSCDFGSYNRKITFQEIAESQSATGAIVKAWGNKANPTSWARVKYLRGDEFSNASVDRQVIARQLVRFSMHYRSDITLKDRVVFEGKNWDIIDVSERGYKEETEVLAGYSDD